MRMTCPSPRPSPQRGEGVRNPRPQRGEDVRSPRPRRGEDVRNPRPRRGEDVRNPRPRRGRGQGEGGLQRYAFLALLVALVIPAPAAAQELDQVVAGLEATYGKFSDLRAEFTQVAHNKSLGQDIKAEGVVYLKKGGKMRWDYKRPSPQQIISDGTSLWVYTPELNQVNKGSAPKALAGPAGSFLAGLGKVREEFKTVRFLNPA